MPFLLDLAVLLAAAATFVVAWRGHRVGCRLALEMIQLRDRLAAIETKMRQAARREASHGERSDAARDHGGRALEAQLGLLGRRLDDLEAEVAHAVEQVESATLGSHEQAPPVADRPADLRELVRKGLRQQGWRRVNVLAVNADQRVRVEAERDGVTAKGLAWVEPDGQVVLRSERSLRAFP